MTLEAESSQNRSHVTIIILNFILVSLTSTITPYSVGLLFRAMVLFHSTHSTTDALNFLPFICLESISSCENYLCLSTCWGWVIIFWALLDSMESKLLVRCKQRFSLVKTLALSLVLVRIYWLDDKGSPLVCHWYWSGLLARWQKSTFSLSLVLVRIFD